MSLRFDSQNHQCLRGGTTVSEELPAIASPPTQTVDLNRVPLGQITEEHADRAYELVDGAKMSSRPRRSQFGSSI